MRIHQGVDMVVTSKLKAVCERHESFISDVFTEAEREYCMSKKNPYVHLAGRFAAKEACLKALGRGLGTQGVDHILKEIEVANEPSGKPALNLSGWALKLAGKLGVTDKAVSISHAGDYAVSTVILSGLPGEKR
jgi:holo-[acyl-carrier protein] synthase